MGGITTTGFQTDAFTDVQARLFASAREKFGADVDLSTASPLRHLIDSFALVISDKGLPNEDIDALWPTLEDLFWSAYPSTASGTALDYVLGFRGLTRQAAQKATGICTFSGSAGTVIPLGTKVSTSTGVEFVTTRQDTIRANGTVDIPCEALVTGGGSNVAAGTITTVVDPVSATVSNVDASDLQRIGHIVSSYVSVANDGGWGTYQTIPTDSLTHPIGLDSFTLQVRNPQASQQFFSVNLAIFDHGSGDLLKQTEILDLTLAANEERSITFSGEDFDVATYDTIRVAFVNLDLSDGPIDLAVDSTEAFAEGDFYLAGVAQANQDMTLSVTTKVTGAFTGGADQETDVDARRRYFEGLSMGGSARLAAIHSELVKVAGVKSVYLEENETDVDKTATGGLPPHSIRATVYGGVVDDIADALLQARCAGVRTVGSRLATVTDEDGHLHTIRFDRPTEVPIYVDIVALKTDPLAYPNDGETQIKDAVVAAIGGVDSDGVFHTGFGVGEDVSHLMVAKAVGSIDGVKAAEILLGKSSPPATEDDITIGSTEIAVTDLDSVRFV